MGRRHGCWAAHWRCTVYGLGEGSISAGSGVALSVAVGSLMLVAVGGSVGAGVTVANSMLIGVKGGVLVAVFGTHSF